MSTADEPSRIVTLDVVRGVAVMGILAMNIVGFALPFQAYMNPAAYGTLTPADLISWAASFVLVDGKMRGLFSFLFGASILLVIERAEDKGADPASIHFRRMLWLLVFGLVHFYLIWFGDILIGYAVIGMLAFLFRNRSVSTLIAWACGLLLLQLLIMGAVSASMISLAEQARAPGASAEIVRQWQRVARMFGPLDAAQSEKVLALFRGSWLDIVRHRMTEQTTKPFAGLLMGGPETLGYMLLGMAGLKSGFLTGAWDNGAYRRVLLIGLAIGVPAYLAIAWAYHRSGFSVPMTFAFVMGMTVPFRPLMVLATAALVILLSRRGGPLVVRIAAAGRTAFTNYLGTSIVMTTLFYGYGFGLYGTLGRTELWLIVLAAWALMLGWSKPWLDRFAYGPFEWLWRTLARGRLQPLGRPASA